MAAKPTDRQLALLAAVLRPAQIAESFGVSASTAAKWIAEQKVRAGVSRGQKRAKASTKKTRAELYELADEMFAIAVKAAREPTFFNTETGRIQQAKLALELAKSAREQADATAPESPKEDRADLLEQIKTATQSAEARRAAVVH